MNWLKTAIIYGSILLIGCTRVSPSAGPATLSTPILPSEKALMTPATQSSATPGLESLIKKAKTDLAQRLSISMDQINLLEARSVVWPDASIGCPQAEMMYAQVLTPGYLMRLEYNHQPYEYHAGKGPDVIYCMNPQAPAPNDPSNI